MKYICAYYKFTKLRLVFWLPVAKHSMLFKSLPFSAKKQHYIFKKGINRKTFSKTIKQKYTNVSACSVNDRPSSRRRTRLSSIHIFLKAQRSKTLSIT